MSAHGGSHLLQRLTKISVLVLGDIHVVEDKHASRLQRCNCRIDALQLPARRIREDQIELSQLAYELCPIAKPQAHELGPLRPCEL